MKNSNNQFKLRKVETKAMIMRNSHPALNNNDMNKNTLSVKSSLQTIIDEKSQGMPQSQFAVRLA